ncbi:restriction endonuclease [Streptomyces sp. NPDC093514]|uniref:restriction endonuclease n=1 Tax=Streptomyces sp. NPDC093514 TaxID=3366039 RepID=UPI003803A477
MSRFGKDWEGDLPGWLAAIGVTGEREGGAEVQDWCFPTDALKEEYISTVTTRSSGEVVQLLRLFLFEYAEFPSDERNAAAVARRSAGPISEFMGEYSLRLLRHKYMGRGAPHPGVRWALDLLGHNPRGAVEVINQYAQAHWQVLPDGRVDGLFDAAEVIRARWLSESGEGRESLLSLSPRELERLVAALYAKLGYVITLTPPQRDGGRDVIAVRVQPGRAERVLVECKMYTRPVGVELVRSLLGVVSHERANKGVLLTVGRFTKGALELSRNDPRIELIDGESFLALLSESFGTTWSRDRTRLTRAHA